MPSCDTNSVESFKSASVRDAPVRQISTFSFLEARRHNHARECCVSSRSKILQRIGAHEEVELADRRQDAVVSIRPARHDGHVEPIFLVGAVGERLVFRASATQLVPKLFLSSDCA